jgi:hypothetical protein
MNHKSLIARICLSLGVILFAACTPATPVPPTSNPVLPTAKLARPTATPDLPTATSVPTVATPAHVAHLNPSPRSEISLAYDSKTDQVLFFGGVDVDPCWADCPSLLWDTWIYDVAANTWTQVEPPSAPTPRDNTAVAYDAESDRIILYAGAVSDGKIFDYAPRDTWVFDMKTKTWTQMKSQGPAYSFGHSMVYDSESDCMIIFGGVNVDAKLAMNDTWAYDYNTDTWTEMKPAVRPPARNFQSMVYDSKADRVIMWGGGAWTDAESDKSLWVYDYNTDTWEERKPSGGPSVRSFQNMAYDSKADRIILYGGYTGSIETKFIFQLYNSSETWAYDYNLNTWTMLKPTKDPGKLTSMGLVYLPTIDRVLLFGGRLDRGSFNDKTWLYDTGANAWTEAIP